MAELVIADGPFKKYPGELVVLKCDEWMGSARGTLSAEDDPRAITGRAVRETQQCSTQILDSLTTTFGEVNDTLTIPVASLPLEYEGDLNGMTYWLWISVAIEGEWNTSESKTMRNGTQDRFPNGACAITLYDSTYETATAFFLGHYRNFYSPRHRPHYMLVSLNGFPFQHGLVGDEVIHLRAYSAPGTSIEILLDQFFFIPYVFSGTRFDEWNATDFATVPGSWADILGSAGFVDGADGGDANGKFTWFPYSIDGNTPLSFSGDDAGGDYQTTDSEYMLHTENILGPIDISRTDPDGPDPPPSKEWAYSVHGAQFYSPDIWVADDFSRTVAPSPGLTGWGNTPEGYAWDVANLVNSIMGDSRIQFSVDGSRGLCAYNFPVGSISGGVAFMGLGKVRQFAQSNNGARIRSGDLSFKAEFEFSSIPPIARIAFILGNAVAPVSGTSSSNYLSIELDAVAGSWYIEDASQNPVSSTIDISSWFGPGVVVGVRIEVRRYRVRARVWDASGSEPSTWDADEFIPWVSIPSVAYPYGDNPFTANNLQFERDCNIEIGMAHGSNGGLVSTVFIDNVEVRWDTEEISNPAPVNALIESPQGTEQGRIEIPPGAWHVVYWGKRQWAVFYGDINTYAIDISTKVWNDPSARELQRAEAPFWWFRSVHDEVIPIVVRYR